METTALLESGLVRSHVAADVSEERAIKERATAGGARSAGIAREKSPRSRDALRLASPFGTPRLAMQEKASRRFRDQAVYTDGRATGPRAATSRRTASARSVVHVETLRIQCSTGRVGRTSVARGYARLSASSASTCGKKHASAGGPQ